MTETRDLLRILKQTEEDLERLGEIDAALGKISTDFERIKVRISELKTRLRENHEQQAA